MVQTTIRMPVKLYQKLKELARNRGVSVNALIMGFLWKAMEAEDTQ